MMSISKASQWLEARNLDPWVETRASQIKTKLGSSRFQRTRWNNLRKIRQTRTQMSYCRQRRKRGEWWPRTPPTFSRPTIPWKDADPRVSKKHHLAPTASGIHKERASARKALSRTNLPAESISIRRLWRPNSKNIIRTLINGIITVQAETA